MRANLGDHHRISVPSHRSLKPPSLGVDFQVLCAICFVPIRIWRRLVISAVRYLVQ
jgi:hypothetical protein